jgi:hypothetical protein
VSVNGPRPEWDAESDVRYGRVGSGLTAIREYVPEELDIQCEGTCSCDYNNPLTALITVYGHQRQNREMLSLQLNISLSAANGSSSSMSQILDSVSQPTVVSGPQAMRQLSLESTIAKARYSEGLL